MVALNLAWARSSSRAHVPLPPETPPAFRELVGILRGHVSTAQLKPAVLITPICPRHKNCEALLPMTPCAGSRRTIHPCRCRIPKDLVVLDRVSRLRLSVCEGTQHTHAFDRLLRDAIDRLGLRRPRRLQRGRRDVDHVVVLVLSHLRVDRLRPADKHHIGGAAVLRMQLRIREWRIVRERPAGRRRHRRVRPADLIEGLEQVFQLLGDLVENAR